jgi:hypothetical protein
MTATTKRYGLLMLTDTLRVGEQPLDGWVGLETSRVRLAQCHPASDWRIACLESPVGEEDGDLTILPDLPGGARELAAVEASYARAVIQLHLDGEYVPRSDWEAALETLAAFVRE